LLAAYAVGSAAVYRLVRPFQTGAVAAFAALLYALAPTRLPLTSLESASLLLCWSLAPALLLALDAVRRGPTPWNVVASLVASAMVLASHPPGVLVRDLLALGELVLILAVCLVAGAVLRRLALAGFLVVAGWVAFFGPPTRPPVPSDLINRASVFADERRPFGAVSLEVELNPIQAQARELIASPTRLEESLLWLRALAVGTLLSDNTRKFGEVLESRGEQGGWSLYELPDPNPAPAVVVSRHQWEKLPPIRGLYDVEALGQYLAWSGRPEAAGFRWADDSSVEIRADLGPLDMLLIRLNCLPGWRAYREGPTREEISIRCDPLGFMAVDPGREGETRVRLAFQPDRQQRFFPKHLALPPLPGGDFPRITPGGVIEAAAFKPPPFPPGASLSIFGHNFVPGGTLVFFGETRGEVLWVGPQQINVRLPQDAASGELAVVVESAGRRSFPERIEVGP
jgi:hypothetical protein